MKKSTDIVRFRKDAFGGVDAINSYDDLPESLRQAVGVTHRRLGSDGPVEMEYAKTMEGDPDFWEVKTIAGKSAA